MNKKHRFAGAASSITELISHLNNENNRAKPSQMWLNYPPVAGGRVKKRPEHLLGRTRILNVGSKFSFLFHITLQMTPRVHKKPQNGFLCSGTQHFNTLEAEFPVSNPSCLYVHHFGSLF